MLMKLLMELLRLLTVQARARMPNLLLHPSSLLLPYRGPLQYLHLLHVVLPAVSQLAHIHHLLPTHLPHLPTMSKSWDISHIGDACK